MSLEPVSGRAWIAGPVISALGESRQTVAVAESLTGGLVCAALVEVPGASAVFRGGIVSYATELKHFLLGVDRELLVRNGPVDPDVAAQMALGVRERLAADWGLATTGVAGPDPQDGIEPGRVYIAIAGPLGASGAAGGRSQDVPDRAESAGQGRFGKIAARVHQFELAGDRTAIRAASVEQALDILLEQVRRPAGSGPALG